MVTIAKRKMKTFFAEGADRIYAKGTQAEVQVQLEKKLVDMLPFGSDAVTSGTETGSERLVKSKMIELFICEVADDTISACSERQSQFGTLINAVL